MFYIKTITMKTIFTSALKMKTSVIFTLFLFVIFIPLSPGFAQESSAGYITIRGEVIDETNNDPVVFASLVVTTLNKGTVTNSEGEFVKSACGLYR